jgi:hypothetical protein
MTSTILRRAVVALAVVVMLVVVAQSHAACCGGGGGMTAFYPSASTSYYAGSYSASYPAMYTTNYSGGWYPGYWMDRIRTRLWGSPSTYVAAYPTMAHSASYAPTYAASYAPTYATTSYAAPAYSSSSTCQSCSYAPACSTCSQQVTLRPVCATCTTGCATCPSCTVPSGVTQTSYQQQPCPTCANGQAHVQTQTQTQQNGAPSPTPAEHSIQTFDSTGTMNGATNGTAADQPSVPENTPPVERQEQKPPVNGDTTGAQPAPGDDTTEDPEVAPYKVNGESSTYFEAPKLHDPNDRTAQRGVLAPVKTAIYKQAAGYRSVATQPQRVTAEQARQDAIGWTSAAK